MGYRIQPPFPQIVKHLLLLHLNKTKKPKFLKFSVPYPKSSMFYLTCFSSIYVVCYDENC